MNCINRLLNLAVPLALSPGVAPAASTPDCVRVNKAQIEVLFDKWSEPLKTGDAQTVSENYLSDAVLLPTVPNKTRLTNAERVDYFGHFLAKKPTGKIGMHTIYLGCSRAIDTGTYIFALADKSTVSARYAFTYAWDDKEWKISTRRSSAMPKE